MTVRQYLWGLLLAVVVAALTYILSTEAPAAIGAAAISAGAWVGGAKSALRSLRS